MIDLKPIYKDSPNGGAFILKINSTKTEDKLERLIFFNPMEIIDVSVKSKKAGYEPGDKVDLKISANIPENMEKGETVYASIMISDLSSILKVESYQQ
jgi:hypothetical protein